MGFSLQVIGAANLSFLQSIAFLFPTFLHCLRILSLSSNMVQQRWRDLSSAERHCHVFPRTSVVLKQPPMSSTAKLSALPGHADTWPIDMEANDEERGDGDAPDADTAEANEEEDGNSDHEEEQEEQSISKGGHIASHRHDDQSRSRYFNVAFGVLGALFFFSSLYRMLAQQRACEDLVSETLWTGSNLHVYFPDGFLAPAACGFASVTSLSLAGRLTGGVPSAIGHFTALEAVNLAHNGLSTLPNEFGQLRSLRELDLSSNRFSSLPRSLYSLQLLRTINAQGNAISSTGVGPQLFLLPHVTVNLAGSPAALSIAWRGGSADTADGVQRLFAAPNGSLARSVGLSLRQLLVEDASVGTIPHSWLSAVPHITSLSLVRCGLVALPPLAGNSMLETLDVSANELSARLQDDFFRSNKFPNLNHINVSHNR